METLGTVSRNDLICNAIMLTVAVIRTAISTVGEFACWAMQVIQ